MPDFGLLSTPNFMQTALLGYQAGSKIAAENRMSNALAGVDLSRPETIMPVLREDANTGIGLLGAAHAQAQAQQEASSRQALSAFIISDAQRKLAASQTPAAKGGGQASTGTTPSATPASSPLTVEALRPLFVAQESGGNYGAVNHSTGALGAYQVMPDTARVLAQRVGLGWHPELMTGTSPTARQYQDQIGAGAIQDAIAHSNGDPHTAFSYYYGGSDRSKWGPNTRAYASQMMNRLANAQPPMDAQPPMQAGMPTGGQMQPAVATDMPQQATQQPAAPQQAVQQAPAQSIDQAPLPQGLSPEAVNLIKADPDLYLKTQASLDSLDKEHLAKVNDAAQAQGAIAAAILDQHIPYAQRRQFIQKNMPYLAAHGVTPEMASQFDPTDENIHAQFVQALGVKGYVEYQDKQADNVRADRKEALDEQNVTSEIAARAATTARGNAARADAHQKFLDERPDTGSGVSASPIPTPSSKAEYDKLPSGARYYKNGVLRIKS